MFIVSHYEMIIKLIGHSLPSRDKFAHTYAGLLLWLLTAILLRKPLSSRLPLVSLVVLEVGNEVIDRPAHGVWQWPDTLGDAAATWFWPFVIAASLRYLPWLSTVER
ncbi:hypothetical protein HMP09_1249 [Sphingomonas sp. HMP9]|uniref:hypothetical protein n=1 Tax=Sphingomonas sp. HMP9 TaxID=1517554 RepID=UPI0015965B20|nr:hypothetical protein [Sphingomonas sp. HMP9]BCA62015.1 hypothetical protein HMP09_1249 [Sphingomonas sp. HMP9]